ncbi:VOC family protein [Rossellomorea marisflavi]|uniref:VOC family protein n=1 Tax=Rossellomorea marisflavi TaxID=189381 RepID=UPI001EE1EB7D|nr:VOC family protein [Rossellomorea marisflavi]MDW4525547.1 VOC family protein [Rossellomorea marisflavi]UKS66254.1 VOC family protein [Rossellomorea marisflavi]WJV18014.1 VOC family protein [Rossellomorea marisflavi]
MNNKLIRIGTIYLPVTDINRSAEWYVRHLGAKLNYQDDDKAILDLANQSVFLVKSGEGESANFTDYRGNERFSVTFEVDGLASLEALHGDFASQRMKVGEIEDRGHAGRNFVFYDPDGNAFDVWSELSPSFRHLVHKE